MEEIVDQAHDDPVSSREVVHSFRGTSTGVVVVVEVVRLLLLVIVVQHIVEVPVWTNRANPPNLTLIMTIVD